MTAVDVHTGEIVAQLTAEDAAELTRDIAGELDFAWDLITRAYQGRAWAALGYQSWDEYCRNEFGASRLALPREDRSEVVQSLRSQGLSLRAIAAATGSSKSQVERDLSSVPNGTVGGEAKPITGVNGKSYQPTRPTKVTERESFSKTTEYPQPAPEPQPEPDVDLDALADQIVPDEINYRPRVSDAIVKASVLRDLDVARAAAAINSADDADGYRRSLRDLREVLDRLLKATQPDHLRSVK